MRKIYVFDFDGVICDSTFECLITSWNAWQVITKKINFKFKVDDFSSEYTNSFIKLRPYVKGAGEFYLVHKSISENIDIKNQVEYNSFLEKNSKKLDHFKKIMYEERNKIRKTNLTLWINLHSFFDEVINVIKQIPEKNLFIATLKDSLSVELLLNSVNIKIEKQHIFDQSKIQSKLDAMNKISIFTENNNLLLIDDNVNHLIPPSQNGFDVLLSKWGNVIPEFSQIAKEYDIKEIFLKNINSILDL